MTWRIGSWSPDNEQSEKGRGKEREKKEGVEYILFVLSPNALSCFQHKKREKCPGKM